jgi:WhiB family redox-sensing transcriptional regulator
MEIHMYDDPSRLPMADLRDGAECRFDIELHDGPDPMTEIEHPDARAAREDVAKEICGTCPVRDLCLTYALRTRPTRGVWAGLTIEEIDRLAALEIEREVA